MKEILQKLDKLSNARPLEIIQKKKEGKKVVEFFGDFVPEQWITAAGAESYLICKGGDPQPPEATLDYMLRFMNPLAATMAINKTASAAAATAGSKRFSQIFPIRVPSRFPLCGGSAAAAGKYGAAGHLRTYYSRLSPPAQSAPRTFPPAVFHKNHC